MLGIGNLKAETKFKDFANGVLNDLMGGKEIKAEVEVNTNGEIQTQVNNIDKSVLADSDFDKDGNVRPEVIEEIKAEKKAIVEKAKANGTYMKAPNGKPTKLSESQWVATRTKRFKNWFGDWETTEKAKVLQGDSIASLNIEDAPNGSFSEITQWARDIFNKQGNKAVNNIIGEVVLNNRSIKDSLAHGGAFKAKTIAFKSVKDVIEKGVLINHSKQSNQDSFYFSAPIEISGTRNIVTVLVRKDVNTQRMYLHSVTIESRLKKSIVSEADIKSKQNGEKTSQSDIAKILNNLLNHKIENSSKVVDENGEPKVYYHGAMKEIMPKDKFKGYVSYFTDSKKYAETFGIPVNREVKSFFLNIRKPYEATSPLADVPIEIHNRTQW